MKWIKRFLGWCIIGIICSALFTLMVVTAGFVNMLIIVGAVAVIMGFFFLALWLIYS